MNLKIELKLFVILSCNIFAFSQLDPGSDCIIERLQRNGICKPITNCRSVLNDIRRRKGYTRCGFQGRTEVVCCPVPRAPVVEEKVPQITANSRISEIKCDEYKSAVYENNTYFNHISGLTTRVVDKCGHKVIPLIVGGEFAKPREFPHMALLGVDKGNGEPQWSCGGALISDEFVLTAAHCLYIKLPSELKFVLLGDLNIDSNNDDAAPELFGIAEVIAHPQYTRRSKYNDIALIRLDRKVQIDPYKRPACLPRTLEGPEHSAIATGWGQTNWSGNSSNHLLKVTLDKFSAAECNQTYSNFGYKLKNGVLPDIQMCAGSKTEARDTCQGDSGGPLQVFHPHQYCMYTLVGVTSFGIGCGTPGEPGIYTRVYAYLDWIENIVWRR